MPIQSKQQPPYYTTQAIPGTITLTHAQILTLPSTPIEIIQAPGQGKIIIPTFLLITTNITTDYTNISPTATLRISYTDGGSAMIAYNATAGAVNGLLAPTASAGDPKAIGWLHAKQYTTGATNTLTTMFTDIQSEYDNRAIEIKITNAALGNLTGGDTANTLKVQLFYQTLNL